MSPDVLDTDAFAAWIGREESASDLITPELVRRHRAVLGQPPGDLAPGAVAPLAIHWCLALPAATASEIGPDGHPKRGGFLPPAPLPRRMWAGGELTFEHPLRIGDAVVRHSRVEDISVKRGRTGALCFVTVRHEISNSEGVALRERHDIVYREITPPPAAAPEPPAVGEARWRRQVAAHPVLLFRYSALTFNGHRIHYDRDYCVQAEHYPGLVFHGPLQATLLLQFAAELSGPPTQFSFRSVGPVFDGGEIGLNARPEGDGLALWVNDQGGRPAMLATAVAPVRDQVKVMTT